MAQWPAWLVPPAGGTAQGVEMSRNRRGVSEGSVDALPALPPCDPVGVSDDVDLAVSAVVAKSGATSRIAPLHDMSPGSRDTSLLGRWMRWSVDKLNALDRKTAQTIPALEKEAADAKRRVKRAVQRELTNQFPPLQVYLADRAFALDEARNAAAQRAREARAREEASAAEAKPKDAKPNDGAWPSELSGTADVKTASTSAVATTLSLKQDCAGKEAPEERPARRKLTDFFVASGGRAEAEAPASTSAEAAEPVSATRVYPPPPTTEEVAREISRASERFSKHARTETKAEREARWASEGAALAASLAATSRPTTSTQGRGEMPAANITRGFFPTAPQAQSEKDVRGGQRVSRGRAEVRAAPVAPAPRLALAPPVTSPDRLTRLAAPNPATTEKPRGIPRPASAEPASPRVSALADRRRGDRADAARRERRARRVRARAAREDGSSEDGSSEDGSSRKKSASVAPPDGNLRFARTGNANPRGSRARLAAPGIQPRSAAVSRETEDAVDRTMARSARVATAGALPEDGTPSKHRRRAFGDWAANGDLTTNAKNLAEKMDRFASSLAAAAASAAGTLSELAEQAYDGGEEFAAGANEENKIRTESVVTVSVDGSDVLVHTRKVAVEGKQI